MVQEKWCVFVLQQTVAGLPALNLPDVCTQSPGCGKAFYAQHCKLLAEEAAYVPHDLREFLKYCGAKANPNPTSMIICNCLR